MSMDDHTSPTSPFTPHKLIFVELGAPINRDVWGLGVSCPNCQLSHVMYFHGMDARKIGKKNLAGVFERAMTQTLIFSNCKKAE